MARGRKNRIMEVKKGGTQEQGKKERWKEEERKEMIILSALKFYGEKEKQEVIFRKYVVR